MKRKENKNSGFTMIELLAVISILAILVLLAIPKYFNEVDNSKDLLIASDVTVAQDAVSIYLMQHTSLDMKLDNEGNVKGYKKYKPKGNDLVGVNSKGERFKFTNDSEFIYNVSELVDSIYSNEGVFLSDGKTVVFLEKSENDEETIEK